MKSIITGNLQGNPNTTSILTLRWWLCSPLHQEHRKSQERMYSSFLSHVWSISLRLPLILGELFASLDSEDYSSLKHILLWDSRISLWASFSPYLSDCSVSLAFLLISLTSKCWAVTREAHHVSWLYNLSICLFIHLSIRFIYLQSRKLPRTPDLYLSLTYLTFPLRFDILNLTCLKLKTEFLIYLPAT